jgi:citrate lyase beta subunit
VLVLLPLLLLLQAAGEIGADSIVMDCEDGVAANMKEQARQTIALMLDGG